METQQSVKGSKPARMDDIIIVIRFSICGNHAHSLMSLLIPVTLPPPSHRVLNGMRVACFEILFYLY